MGQNQVFVLARTTQRAESCQSIYVNAPEKRSNAAQVDIS